MVADGKYYQLWKRKGIKIVLTRVNKRNYVRIFEGVCLKTGRLVRGKKRMENGNTIIEYRMNIFCCEMVSVDPKSIKLVEMLEY